MSRCDGHVCISRPPLIDLPCVVSQVLCERTLLVRKPSKVFRDESEVGEAGIGVQILAFIKNCTKATCDLGTCEGAALACRLANPVG